MTTVSAKATGIAFFAGQFSPTNKMAAVIIGKNAINASNVLFIFFPS